MTDDTMNAISISLRAVASAFAELSRQKAQGGAPSFQFVTDTLTREATRLQVNGQPQLAGGMLALRDELGAMTNG